VSVGTSNDIPSPNPMISPDTTSALDSNALERSKYRIGFITSPFYDPKIPVNDHLHVHAFEAPMDLAGWWRRLVYSGIGWYSMDDLVAEIR
jgi:hypothetical protein